jgi:DNA (cytosine-5)-methyltransferase 1
MKFIDWFAGSGGFTKTMKKYGHQPAGFCEIDKFAVKSYQAIHEPKEGEWFAADIRNVQSNGVPNADIYCFGWPCQDNSIAGKRRGQGEGTRSGLLFEIARIIRVKKPSYFVAENVEGLFSVNNGIDFYQTIRLFTDLGYDVQWQLLNTMWFLPQNRERIYFVGHLRGLPRPEVFPIIPTDRKINNSNQRLRIIPVLTPGREVKGQNGRRFKEPGEPMFTLTRQDIHGIAIVDDQGRNNKEFNLLDKCPTLRSQSHGNEPKIIQQNQRRECFIKDHSGAITQHYSSKQSPKVFDGISIRKLTPLEYWRFQGWEDTDFYKAAAVNSDTQLYKQAGNGISLPVAEEVIKKLTLSIKEANNAKI